MIGRKCSSCGCWGQGVARFKGSRCGHCVRVENKARVKVSGFVQHQLEAAFLDISEEGNLSLLKKEIQAGDVSSGSPLRGCSTFVQFVGRVWNEEDKAWDEIFETTRDLVDGKHAGGTDDPYEFQLGRFNEDTIQDDFRKEKMDPMFLAMGRCFAWDLAVATMCKNEISQFICHPNLAYREHGRPPKVPSHAFVLFEFELVSWEEPLPIMPTREALEKSRQEREAKELLAREQNPPPSVDERVKHADESRQIGNQHMEKHEYELAKQCYDKAFVHLFMSRDEYTQLLTEEEKSVISKTKLKLHLNRALCKMKLGHLDDALWDCNQATEIEANNAKALFRRCQLRCKLLHSELEKEKRREFWLIETAVSLLRFTITDFKILHGIQPGRYLLPLRTEITSLESKLKEYAANHRDASKEKLFQKRLLLEHHHQQQHDDEDEELHDMPELEP